MSVDLYSEHDLRAAIDELADEAPHITPVVAILRPQRSRRPVRWLAPLAAAAVVLLVVGSALFLTRRGNGGAETIAVGPTEATAAHPCRSSTSPPFDTFVLTRTRTVGTVTCSGYRLKYVQADLVDSVTLYRPGVLTLKSVLHRHRVAGAGVSGWVGTMSPDSGQPCQSTDPNDAEVQVACRSTVFAWQYAAHAWGVVAGVDSAPAATLLRVAGSVRLRAVPLRFPVHLAYVPARLHASRASSYDDPPPALDNGVTGAELQLSRGATVVYDIAVESRTNSAAYGRGLAFVPVRIGRNLAYVDANNRTAAMRHNNCELTIRAKEPTTNNEFIRILRGAQFSDCTKPSTWPTANAAVGG